MFRSSVAAFYQPRPDALATGGAFTGRIHHRFPASRVRAEIEQVVYRMAQILFATEIAFRCLDGGMAQQELYLLQLATATVAQFRTGSPQIMRCNML